jgi:hypothetical protein
MSGWPVSLTSADFFSGILCYVSLFHLPEALVGFWVAGGLAGWQRKKDLISGSGHRGYRAFGILSIC